MSFRYETVDNNAVGGVVKDAPDCIYPLLENPGVKAMHIYIRDYHVRCS